MIEFLLWVILILLFCVVSSYIAKAQKRPDFLIATFASLIVLANIIAVKPTVVWNFVAPAAVIVYSVTFLLTDMLCEFYSKEDARRAVWAGFFASILLVAATTISVKMTPAPFWAAQQEHYAQFLGLVPRIVLASMIAYLISQHHDVFIFHWWKQKTKGKHLWLRNNASTAVSQFLDTLLFITIAFYGVFPITQMIVGQYVIKLGIAVLDTPFMYLSRAIYSKS